jgi:hypothetical protein
MRIAVRIDEQTWDTWGNHIQRGPNLEATSGVLLRDPSGSNVWP